MSIDDFEKLLHIKWKMKVILNSMIKQKTLPEAEERFEMMQFLDKMKNQ